MAGFSVPSYTWFYQGAIAAGGQVFVYKSTTTTLENIYSDGALTSRLSNPLTLDTNGQCSFYVSGADALRLDGYAAAGGFIKTFDPVYPVSNTTSGTVVDQNTNLTLSTANNGNNIIATAAINISLPLSATLSNSFSVQLNAQGGAITLIPVSTDKIQNQTAGATFTLAQGTSGQLWTDANGNWGLNFLSGNTLTPTQVAPVLTGGFINKFRNPGMAVAQRGTAGTITTGNTAYALDGYMINPTGASVVWGQAGIVISPNGTSSAHSMSLVGAASMTSLKVSQRIESTDAASLAGRQVTFQAVVDNFTGSTIIPKLTTQYITATDNWGSPVTDINAVSLQSCPNNGVTIVSYTFPVNANAYNGYNLILDLGAVVTATVYLTQFDVRATPGVLTGLNSSPAPVEQPGISLDMSRCQRYYTSTFGNGITPAQNTTYVGGFQAQPYGTSAGELYTYWQFPVQMRVAPTIVTYNPAAANANWHDKTGSADAVVSVDPDTTISPTGVLIGSQTTVLVTGHRYYIQATATAEL